MKICAWAQVPIHHLKKSSQHHVKGKFIDETQAPWYLGIAVVWLAILPVPQGDFAQLAHEAPVA